MRPAERVAILLEEAAKMLRCLHASSSPVPVIDLVADAWVQLEAEVPEAKRSAPPPAKHMRWQVRGPRGDLGFVHFIDHDGRVLYVQKGGGRRSGRTYDMLQDAARRMDQGRTVQVVALDRQHAGALLRMFLELPHVGQGRLLQHRRLSVGYRVRRTDGTGTVYFCSEWDRDRNELRGVEVDFVFEDHAVIERREQVDRERRSPRATMF